MVCGKNPNLPTVIGSEPPVLEGVSSSKLIVEHLNCMHTARKAFIESEASDKLRRAFLQKTRTATSLVYEVRDLVHTKGMTPKDGEALAQSLEKTETKFMSNMVAST